MQRSTGLNSKAGLPVGVLSRLVKSGCELMLNTVCLLLVCPAGSSNMVGYDGKMYLNDEGAQPSSAIINHIFEV